MDIVDSSRRSSTSSSAERIVNEMNSLDLSILGLTSRIEENYQSQELIDQETKDILKQLEALKKATELPTASSAQIEPVEMEVNLNGIEPMDWETFNSISDSSIHSDSLLSDSDNGEQLKKSPTYMKNGSIHDPNDPFCDPRQIQLMQEYWNISKYVQTDIPPIDTIPSLDDFPKLAISELHEEVMELLRLIRSKSEEQDQELGDYYIKQKRNLLQLSCRTPFGESSVPPIRYGVSEYEEWKSIVSLWGEELLYGMLNQIPDQIPMGSQLPQVKQFIDTSRFVSDAEQDLLKHFECKPWSEEEKKIFMEKFIEHPKDFYKIAQFLPYRTTGDCVEFFYSNKKLDEFGNVRRKQQLKKRRLQSESNKEAYSQLMTLGGMLTSKKPPPPPSHHHHHRLLTEQQKKRELRSWLLDRIEKQEQLELTDEQLISAVRKFGLDYKAVAKEVDCDEASFIGSYLMIHRRRLGLDEYFENRPAMSMRRVESEQLSTAFRTENRLHHGAEISRRGSDQFPVNREIRNGIEDLPPPPRMPSYLMSGCEQNDQMKVMLQKLPHYSFHTPTPTPPPPTKDCKPS
eukprot:g3937.t1